MWRLQWPRAELQPLTGCTVLAGKHQTQGVAHAHRPQLHAKPAATEVKVTSIFGRVQSDPAMPE